MTVLIRPACEADVEALVTLIRRSWLATWAPEVPFDAVKWFVAHDPARHDVETNWPHMTVAAIGGEVVGELRIKEDYVRSIQLAPERKRQGIGSRLMDEAEGRIRKTHPSARLDVRAFNVGAIAFYRRRGWTEHRRYEGRECTFAVETLEMVKHF